MIWSCFPNINDKTYNIYDKTYICRRLLLKVSIAGVAPSNRISNQWNLRTPRLTSLLLCDPWFDGKGLWTNQATVFHFDFQCAIKVARVPREHAVVSKHWGFASDPTIWTPLCSFPRLIQVVINEAYIMDTARLNKESSIQRQKNHCLPYQILQ